MAQKLFDLTNYTQPAVPNLSVWTSDLFTVYVVQDVGSGIYKPFTDSTSTTNSTHIGTISDYKWCGGSNGMTLAEYVGIAAFPFAEIRFTSDAPYCGSYIAPGVVNITGITAMPESSFGKQDGQVTILATSNEPDPIGYSLDNTNWTSNNVFTDLEPGEYTAYVRVYAQPNPYIITSGGYEYDSESFTIEPGKVTSYGDRYRVEFNDPIGSLWEIIIQQSGYAGAMENICGTGDPLEIVWGGSSGGRFQGVIGSEARIRLISTVNFQFIDLFTADDREYRALVFRDKALYWKGYLMNDVYREDYVDAAYEVEVLARDGLGTLKEMLFQQENGKEYKGDKTLLEIVYLCLKKLDLDLELWESVSWYESQMLVGDNYSPLTQATQSLALYYKEAKPWNCYEVLDRLLKSLCASLYQSDGTWHITQDNWVYQTEANPEPIVYPPITFELSRIGYGDQKGKARIINPTGGDPLQGPFMVAVGDGPYVPMDSLPVSPKSGVILSGLPIGQSVIRVKRETGPEVTTREIFFQLNFQVVPFYGQGGNNVTVVNMDGGETDDGYEFSDNGSSWTLYNNLNVLYNGKGYSGLSNREGYIHMRWRNAPETAIQVEYFIDMGFTVRKETRNGFRMIILSQISGIGPVENARFNLFGSGWHALTSTALDFKPVEGSPGSYYRVVGNQSGNMQMRYLNDNSYIVTRSVPA